MAAAAAIVVKITWPPTLPSSSAHYKAYRRLQKPFVVRMDASVDEEKAYTL